MASRLIRTIGSACQRYTVAAKQALPAGKTTIRVEFAYDAEVPARVGLAPLFVNGKNVATGRSNVLSAAHSRLTTPPTWALDEGTPVTEAYTVPAKFTGRLPR